MNEVWVVDLDVARVKADIDRLCLIDMGKIHLATEDIVHGFGGAHRLEREPMAFRDDAETAILRGGRVQREPKGDDFHRLEGLAVERAFGDVVRREQRDVRPYEILGDVEKPMV